MNALSPWRNIFKNLGDEPKEPEVTEDSLFTGKEKTK